MVLDSRNENIYLRKSVQANIHICSILRPCFVTIYGQLGSGNFRFLNSNYPTLPKTIYCCSAILKYAMLQPTDSEIYIDTVIRKFDRASLMLLIPELHLASISVQYFWETPLLLMVSNFFYVKCILMLSYKSRTLPQVFHFKRKTSLKSQPVLSNDT